jgi:hypothetical protein
VKRVFVDTSGVFALYSANDADHVAAVDVFRQANDQRWQLITTNMVVAETHALLDQTAVILRAADIDRAEIELEQRLNPRSRFRDAWLAHAAGLSRIGLSRGRIPPGGESFAYHAHHAEQEWLYIVTGRARARIDDRETVPGSPRSRPRSTTILGCVRCGP